MRELTLKHLGKQHRKINYADGTFHHPAKMHPELARWIIEEYTNEGDYILDPMAGVGTTLIEGMLLGRNMVGIELEKEWAELLNQSINMQSRGIMPMGTAKVIWGDATKRITFDKHIGMNDVVITSPPYGIDMHGGGIAKEQRPGGFVPYDTVITSPPYGNRLADEKVDDGDEGRMGYRQSNSKNKHNLGNYLLHTFEYQEGMMKVYAHCYWITNRGGKMITVTKNFYYKGELQRLDSTTKRLVENAGWEFEEQIKFKLPYDSMWQKMYAKKYPEREIVKHEDVLVFGK